MASTISSGTATYKDLLKQYSSDPNATRSPLSASNAVNTKAPVSSQTATQTATNGLSQARSASASTNASAPAKTVLGTASGLSSGSALSSVPAATQATTAPVAAATPNETTAAASPTATMYTPTTAPTVSTTSRTTTSSSNFQPQTYTPTGMYDPANLQAYNAQREAQIRQMYADAQQSALAGLKTAYDQNLSDATAYRDQISPQYQRSMSALGAEYERQRRNNNMQAAANGLNTGAGSQMALAQSANYQANQAGLAAKENQALDEANRRLIDLKASYQNAIVEATAQNNYKLAASLLDEYQNAYNRQLNIENTNYQREQAIENQNYTRQWNEDERSYTRGTDEAARKASYGDFSGYADLYGEDIARNMELTWAMQNPQIAWATGKLSAEDYQTLTGNTPNGASAIGSTSGASGGTTDEYGITYLPNGNIMYAGREYGRAGKTAEQLSDYDLNPSLIINYAKSKAANGGRKINLVRPRYLWNSGRGYSASKDTAYRGAPGYLNTDGQFVVPGTSYGNYSNTTAASGHEGDKVRADAYNAAYNQATASGYGTGGATVAATKAGQTAAQTYEQAARSR